MIALLLASAIGFSVGRWAVPSRGAAATSISIAARPLEVTQTFDPLTLYGAIATGQAGEEITIEEHECGNPGGYHVVPLGTTTAGGGAWVSQLKPGQGPSITASYRARWKNGTSDPVTVRVHPFIFFNRVAANRFHLWISLQDILRGRTCLIQRFNSRTGRWDRVASFALRRVTGPYTVVYQSTVRLRVHHGWRLRAFVAKRTLGPCYLAGYSVPLQL